MQVPMVMKIKAPRRPGKIPTTRSIREIQRANPELYRDVIDMTSKKDAR